MSSLYLLVAAYALIWALLFGYLLLLGRRQARLRREIEGLRKAVDGFGERESKGD